MFTGEEASFDEYLDLVFAGSNWFDVCTGMLAAFLDDLENCRDHIDDRVPSVAPSILDQVARLAERARHMEGRFREQAESRGPAFKTRELGALLWWAGLAAHQASADADDVRRQIAGKAWSDVFFTAHRQVFDTVSALSLLAQAEQTIARMEQECGSDAGRPN